MNINGSAVSRSTLEGTPARTLELLRGVSKDPTIRATLEGVGYTESAHALGWKLVLDASGYDATGAAPPVVDERARQAIAALDAWDEGAFRRIAAALKRFHPEQAAFLFEGIAPSTDVGAVVSSGKLLERLDALEAGSARPASCAADRAAIALLATRGFDAAERSRVKELVRVAQTAKPTSASAPPSTSDATYEQKLAALRAWYEDWSETARAVVQRRDQRRLLGLARWRRAADEVAGEEADTLDGVEGA
jgi:hypothetical protein